MTDGAWVEIELTGDLWRLTMEHSPVGMALVTPDGRCVLANRVLAEMLGRTPEDLTRLPFDEVTHPDDLAEDERLFRETMAGARPSYRIRKRYLHADGSVVWGDLSLAAVPRPDGAVSHAVSQVVDVTELVRARQRLDDQARLAQAVFNGVDVGLLLIDAEGRYQGSNRSHHDFMMLAFPDGHEGRAGQDGEVYVDGSGTPMAYDDLPSVRAWRGEEFDDVKMWIGSPERAQRVLSASARSVREADGSFDGAALAYTDVTDLVRALTVRDEFLASVSHELRTPLTSVLGHLELLVDDPGLDARVSERLEVVNRNAVRLGSLVADLLQVARDREGRLPVDLRESDLVPVVVDALEAVRPAVAAASLDLRAELPDTLPARADAGRFRQVVDNLVTNAVKYTRPGGTVRVSLTGAPDQLALVVSDDGIGIEPGELDRLFDRFYRSERVQAEQIAGTGLGLSIVRSIVEAHRGTIAVDSLPGVGTTVTVRLPVS